jgi:hypothetical protein
MSVFTESAEADEIYAATNPYMRFAIELLDEGYTKIANSHSGIAHWYDKLLPLELKTLNYQPAIEMTHNWINLFFGNRSRGGLIPTLAKLSGKRIYQDAQGNGEAGWVHTDGDLRIYGVLEGRYASTVNMIRRIREFLAWVPDGQLMLSDGQLLQAHCITWASSFMQANNGSPWYGHRVTESSWQLYNYVQTGPAATPPGVDEQTYANPANFPGDFNERFDRAFRFALEGFPDSWWVMVDGYGAVAQAFVRLSTVTGDTSYADFASQINEGLWHARLNHATYLMPDTVTPRGPLPGDQALINNQLKYTHDTDCLYWARALFDAYGLVGSGQRSLTPTPAEEKFCNSAGTTIDLLTNLPCRIRLRRRKLSALLKADFPDRYLGMALGLTLEWIRYGWNPQHKQFIRKIAHDGTAGETLIYGDGKWNTLYVLLEAYRFTHDPFYLALFDQAWQQWKKLADQLGGLFPGHMENGALSPTPVPSKCWKSHPAPDNVECYQEFFLDVIVHAYLVTVTAKAPRPDYLTDALTLAGKIQAEHQAGRAYYNHAHGIIGGAFVRLAQAQGTMHRIVLKLSGGPVSKLSIQDSTQGIVEITVKGHQRAVIYMDVGDYQVIKHFSDNQQSLPISLQVVSDGEIEL